MTPSPYFRWAFVVICPICVCVKHRSRCGPSAYTFPSPCHLGTGAWRRAPPHLIEDAGRLRCHAARATVAAEERLVGHGAEALEECVTHLLIGEVLRVRNEQEHLKLREKVKWGYGELVAVASKGKENPVFLLFKKNSPFFLRELEWLMDLGTNFSLIYLVWWCWKGESQPRYALWWGIQKEFWSDRNQANAWTGWAVFI